MQFRHLTVGWTTSVQCALINSIFSPPPFIFVSTIRAKLCKCPLARENWQLEQQEEPPHHLSFRMDEPTQRKSSRLTGHSPFPSFYSITRSNQNHIQLLSNSELIKQNKKTTLIIICLVERDAGKFKIANFACTLTIDPWKCLVIRELFATVYGHPKLKTCSSSLEKRGEAMRKGV